MYHQLKNFIVRGRAFYNIKILSETHQPLNSFDIPASVRNLFIASLRRSYEVSTLRIM